MNTRRTIVDFNGNLSIEVFTGEMTEAQTNGVMFTSFAFGGNLSGGSTGKIVSYYQRVFNVDISGAVKNSGVCYTENMPYGMAISRVDGIPGCDLFSKLWVASLNQDYDQDSLSAMYSKLKNVMSSIMEDSVDGTLTMPLLGSHPREGVHPSDVFEEILSLFVYCSRNVPRLKKIVLLVREDSLLDLLSVMNHDNSFSDLLPANTDQLMDGISLYLSNQRNIPEVIRESLVTISIIWESLKYQIERDDPQLAFVLTVCGQGRRILEFFCRHLSGDSRMNAGFSQVDQLVRANQLPLKAGEICKKLVRNGNKAVHTDTLGSDLTIIDANLTISCILYLIRDDIINLNPVSTNQKTDAIPNGDWVCMICKVDNFSNRTSCYGCAAPKGSDSSGRSTSQTTSFIKPGDWICSTCNTNNFASRDACYGCSAPKGEFQPILSGQNTTQNVSFNKPGDWICSTCNTNNFASRDACYGCSAPKGGFQPILSGQSTSQNTSFIKPGDWVCSSCTANNFGSRDACYICSSPKESVSSSQNTIPQSSFKPGDWICSFCTTSNFASRDACYGCSTPKILSGQKTAQNVSSNKPGDWICSTCNTNNFASRDACYGCSAPKEVHQNTSNPTHSRSLKPGDWICKNCSTNNFAKKTICFSCRTPKH